MATELNPSSKSNVINTFGLFFKYMRAWILKLVMYTARFDLQTDIIISSNLIRQVYNKSYMIAYMMSKYVFMSYKKRYIYLKSEIGTKTRTIFCRIFLPVPELQYRFFATYTISKYIYCHIPHLLCTKKLPLQNFEYFYWSDHILQWVSMVVLL